MAARAMLVLLVLSAAVADTLGQTTTLGVLEDVPGTYYGEPSARRVRVVFQKNGPAWKAFPSVCSDQDCLKTIASEYPPQVTWTIAFDGRQLGKVTARTPKDFQFYSHVGLQEIIGGGPVPRIAKKSEEYGGFLGAAVYRPLVANSRPYFRDPESWKPAQLPAEAVRLLRQEFRRQFPRVCKESSEGETKLEPFLYRDDEVAVVKAYASKKGWAIAELHLEEGAECDSEEAGFGLDAWFVADPQRLARFLDQGIRLLDTGDYDNDGQSELVFSIDRYNRGGYELFYDNFRKRAVFEFFYH